MREIPDNINITETSTSTNNEGLEDVIFDERYNNEKSSGDEQGLPHNTGNGNDSVSDEESDEDDDNFYNPNRMPKKTGNLNAKNLIGSKKDNGKGARNDRREGISGSDTEGNDELAHI
jgi:hypothetical protein